MENTRNQLHKLQDPERDFNKKLKWLSTTMMTQTGELLPDEQILSKYGAYDLIAVKEEAPEQWELLKDYMAFLFIGDYIPEAVKQWMISTAKCCIPP